MGGDASAPRDVAEEAARRRTFAVISHPDAGKSTLTEALALHAAAIDEAGAVHGKAGRRGVRSDWMDMERARGISITSSVLRFEHGGMLLNLLDTPGHADFSEDTYRVLAAVDGAIMLLDSAKGLEAQTLKLFDVCRHRGVPVITFVNKWDRPGREPLELLDEIEQRIGLRPAPLNWPVGVAGDFRGLIDRASGSFTRFHRTPGGARRAVAEHVPAERAAREEGGAWETAVEELALQFDVVAARMADEFTAPVELTRLDYSTARVTDKESAEVLNGRRGVEVLTRTLDGSLIAVFVDRWRLRAIEREHPGVTLTPMLAAGVPD